MLASDELLIEHELARARDGIIHIRCVLIHRVSHIIHTRRSEKIARHERFIAVHRIKGCHFRGRVDGCVVCEDRHVEILYPIIRQRSAERGEHRLNDRVHAFNESVGLRMIDSSAQALDVAERTERIYEPVVEVRAIVTQKSARRTVLRDEFALDHVRDRLGAIINQRHSNHSSSEVIA